jgi:hypothetical protein
MKISSGILSISLLLWIGVAYAEPSEDHGRGLRNDARAIQFEQIAERRERARAERELRQDVRNPDTNARKRSELTQEHGVPARVDEARRPARMNPDERRALRQQIHEVGHDIYTPPR